MLLINRCSSLRLRFRRLHRARTHTHTSDTSDLQFNVCVYSFLQIMEIVQGKKNCEKNRQLLETETYFESCHPEKKSARTCTRALHHYTHTHAKAHKHYCWPAKSLGSVLYCPDFSSLAHLCALHLYNKRNAQSPTAKRAETHFPSSSYS